jgi:hypothetical protein
MRQGAIVLEPLAVVLEVVGGLVHRFARALAELLAGGGTAQAHRHVPDPTVKHGGGPIPHPVLALLGVLRV